MPYFDYETIARQAGIPADKLRELCQVMKAEFPGDEMMSSLHVLRAVMAVRDGRVRLEDILRPAGTATGR